MATFHVYTDLQLQRLAYDLRLSPEWTSRADAAVKDVIDALQHPDIENDKPPIRWNVVGGYAKQTSTCLKADVDLGKWHE